MASLRIQLFGAFHLVYGDEFRAQPLQARAQSLLAYLILNRRAPQPRQHLAFSLWPDSSEEQAYNNLRKTLYQLRAALPDADELLRTDTRTVQWLPDAACQVDVIEFEQQLAAASAAISHSHLMTAVALYTGDLLPGCYDDWIVPQRERLREQNLAALQRLIDYLEQSLDYPAAIHQANCLLRIDPLHEETYRRLMRLHALRGDRPAALRTYHTCATTLLRELGVDPSPPTQAAYTRLLHLDLSSSAPPPPSAARVQDVLVGRKAEWRSLLAAWQQCAGGHTHFVVIGGEAGAGKTRLAQELARWAERQGINIARTRAYAGEEGLAYAPVIDWLRSATLRAGLDRVEPVWLGELARLVPDLLPSPAARIQPDAVSERWQRQRLFAALNCAVLAVPAPLILMVDDLQWCDQETLEWLHHLLHSAPAACLLVLGTVRADEVDSEHPLSSLLLRLRGTGQITEIDLAPMNEVETAELALHVAEQPLAADVVARLYQMTEGNPLFITESVRALLSEPLANGAAAQATALPAKVQAVILQRLARLSPAARELANLAAVIGRSFTLPVLYQAYGADEDTLVHSLDELWQRRIVREQGAESYDFSHDLIRETAYASVSTARRRLLHRRVAEALERAPNSDRLASAQIAWHYEQAGLPGPAIAHYSQAAATARQMYAFQDAIAYITRALDLLALLPPSSERVEQEMDLQSALGAAWSVVKTYAAWEAKHAFDRAFALSNQQPASPRMFTALWGLHEFHIARSEYERALHIAEECLRIAQDLQDPALLLEAHHAMWGVLVFMNRYPATIEHVDQALPLYQCEQHQALALQFAGHDAAHCGLSIAGVALWASGYPSQARQRLQAAIELMRQLTVPSSLADAAYNHTMLYQLLGDTQATLAWAETTVRLSTECSYAIGQAIGTALAGWAHAMRGDHVAGLALLASGMAQWQAEGLHIMQTYLSALWIEACCAAGRVEEGIAHTDRAHDFVVEYGEQFFAPEIYRLRGELLQAQGDQRLAESCFQQALGLAREQDARSLELRAAVSLARLWQAQGRPQAAHEVLAPVYAWFGEGFETPDLQAAHALLAVLAV